ARAEEQVAYRQRLLQDSAGIAAQVHDDALRTPGDQSADRLFDLGRRVLIEALQRHIAHIAEGDGVRHGRHVNDGARELHLDGLRDSGTAELHADLGARRSGQDVARLLRGPAPRRGGVHLHDAIALTHPITLGWRMREHATDHDLLIARLDLHPETAVASTRSRGELLELLR